MSAISQSLTFSTYDSTSSVQVVYPLWNTGTNLGTLIYISDKVPGDGYYGNSNGLHTVMYNYDTNFIGTITMQATLAAAPVEADWFNVADTTSVQTSSTVTYNDMDVAIESDYYNFTGNFVWVRGYIAIDSGQVESVLYNH